jgi:ADP-heptose:LPS heptosyltransferase
LYIGNDSALMHLAAASGAPTLGLFGPSRDDIYGPWGLHTAVARTPESLKQIWQRPDYDYRLHHSYMGTLTVDAVVEAAERLWRDAKVAA